MTFTNRAPRLGAIALALAAAFGAALPAATMAQSAEPVGSPAASTEPMASPPVPAASGQTGSITISGSSTVQPISTAVQELFNDANPGVAITVDGPGTGDGFQLFCSGETDISDASRAIKPTGEADVCAQNGVNYVELKVALDGLSVITSASNDQTTCLTFADLYALTGPESVGFQNWKDGQEIATALGSTTVFPDAPLTITGPGEESGTYDFYVEKVIAPLASQRGLPAEQGLTRPDYQASANDNTIIEGVAGTPDNNTTLGWVGFAYVEENLDKVKPLEVDGGNGCVAPSHDTVADASYPISRDLFIYVNVDKAKSNPALKAFVDYYLQSGTVDYVLQTVPYVALAPDVFTASQAAWAAATQ